MTNNYCSPTGEHASEDEGGFFGEEMNAFSIAWIATAVLLKTSIFKKRKDINIGVKQKQA